MLRTFFATPLSPLWAPIYTAFFTTLYMPEQAELAADWTLLYKASIYWTFGLVYGYIPMLILAPMAHMVLRWRNYQSLSAYIITWFLISQLLWWGYLNLAPLENGVFNQLVMAFFFNLPWIPAGATFWAIVRPDRRSPKNGKAVELNDRAKSTPAASSRQQSSFGMRGRAPQ